MQDTANPSFPASEPSPLPETPPSPPAFNNPPSMPIAGASPDLPPDPNMTTPTSAPDLTVPQPPQFPNGNNTPAPSPMDPPIMVRGENTIPNVAASSPGLTTATILPVGSGGQDLVSYPSGGGSRRFLLPIIIGGVLLLAVLGGAFYFFSQSTPSEGIQAPPESSSSDAAPTETITQAPQITTATYQNTEFGFSVDYPQDWAQKENVNGNVVVFTDAASGSTTPSKISVLEEATLSELTSYGESLQKIFSQLYTGWVNVNTTPTTIGTLQALEVESTYTKGAVNMSVLQMIVIREGKAYTITAEAEETAFLDLRDTFTQVLSSVQFSN